VTLISCLLYLAITFLVSVLIGFCIGLASKTEPPEPPHFNAGLAQRDTEWVFEQANAELARRVRLTATH
jgi:hypothetical protein